MIHSAVHTRSISRSLFRFDFLPNTRLPSPNACEMHCRSFHGKQHIWARNLSPRKIRKAKNQIYLFIRNNFSDRYKSGNSSLLFFYVNILYFQPKCVKRIHDMTEEIYFLSDSSICVKQKFLMTKAKELFYEKILLINWIVIPIYYVW